LTVAALENYLKREMTVDQILDQVVQIHGKLRGISRRSIQRMMEKYDLSRWAKLPPDELERQVVKSVGNVRIHSISYRRLTEKKGHYVGSRKIQADLYVRGFNVPLHQVLHELGRIYPEELAKRLDHKFKLKKQVRPIYAPYFGYQMACDQNEVLKR